MRSAPFMLAAALVVPASASAQALVSISAGATIGSTLIRDPLLREGSETTLKPAVAPTGAVAFSYPTGKSGGYRIGLELRYGTSTLNIDDGGEHDTMGKLATLAVAGFIEGAARWGIRWQVGGGKIFYRPGEKRGIFLDESPTRWLVIAGLRRAYPIGRQLSLVGTIRYDFHQFTTRTLQARDYQLTQGIHRVGLLVGVERSF